MKTAMQELIEWCNSCLTDLTISDGAKTALEVTIVRANDLLEKEKEQIISAYKVGKVEAKMFLELNTTAQQYYNQTYNQNK